MAAHVADATNSVVDANRFCVRMSLAAYYRLTEVGQTFTRGDTFRLIGVGESQEHGPDAAIG